MKIAIIFRASPGLAASPHAGQAAIPLFEAGDYFGGHTHGRRDPADARSGRGRHAPGRYRFPGLQRAHPIRS